MYNKDRDTREDMEYAIDPQQKEQGKKSVTRLGVSGGLPAISLVVKMLS